MNKSVERRERQKLHTKELSLDHGIERHKKAIQRLMALKVSLRIQAEDIGLRFDDER